MSLSSFVKSKIPKTYMGKKARDEGLAFQALVIAAASHQGFHCIEIPQGCKIIRSGAKLIFKKQKTPFDISLSKAGKVIYADAKFIGSGNLVYSILKDHQVEALYGAEIIGGISAGYIVNFKQENKVVFFHASALKRLRPKTSLTSLEGTYLGESDKFNISRILEG